MKKIILLLVMAIVTLSVSAQNQQQQRPNHPDGNFLEFQTQVLIKQLQVEESRVADFTKLYTEYAQKSEALQPKPQRRGGGNDSQKSQKPTEAEIEAQILEIFDMAEKSTELKREYYYKFKEILSSDQILKMYNVERRMRERIVSESDKRAEDQKPRGGQSEGRK
ncbi:MAG: hypothetical protein SNG10_06420 [Rikenellaceae bacterium]